MAKAKQEFAGGLVAYMLRHLSAAIWSPKELPANLNPFHEESEALKAHREKLRIQKVVM